MQTQSRYLSNIIINLPLNQRLVLSMYYSEKLSFEEIGRVLGIPPFEVRRLYISASSKCLNYRRPSHLKSV